MKIEKIKIDNFKGMQRVEVVFDEKVTHIIGLNGAGKSTLLDAIWACFKGVGSKGDMLIGDRYRVIGDIAATSNIELTLRDEMKDVEIVVSRKIGKTANSMTIAAPKGYKINNEWVNNLLSVAFFNARNFTLKSPQEQAKLLGVDTSKYDSKMRVLKEDYTYDNRDIKRIGELVPVEEVKAVDIAELVVEKDEIDRFNRAQEAVYKEEVGREEAIRLLEEEIENREANLKYLRSELDDTKHGLAQMTSPVPPRDLKDINAKIAGASEVNDKAALYQAYLRKKKEKDANIDKLAKNKVAQGKLQQEKNDYVKGLDLNVRGISFDDNGGLVASDKDGNKRPLKQGEFSTGEMYKIILQLYAATKPELRTVFLDNFESLDPRNQDKIIQAAEGHDLQVITASVGEAAKESSNTILLRECKVVKEDGETLL